MKIYPFKGWRPSVNVVEKIICPPYDVVSPQEAREFKANEDSFMHVIRSEIDFPENFNPYSPEVYKKALENLNKLKEKGFLNRDKQRNFYLYQQVMGEHVQTGLVATCHIQDYIDNKIKKHELTRKEKEQDRTTHIITTKHNTGPVFLFYKENRDLEDFIEHFITNHDPEYNITTDDGIKHIFWIVENDDDKSKILEYFESVECLYIADGHHRAASSVNAGKYFMDELKVENNEDDHLHFLSIIFPAKQLYILDYNRIVMDLNGLSQHEFLDKVREKFEVIEQKEKDNPDDNKPEHLHEISMYLDGRWYLLKSKPGIFDENDILDSLDVNILYKNILAPILGIGDARVDKRIDFVGGIRGYKELERLVDSGKAKVAFGMYPTTIEQLMEVSDRNMTMPPKSTWFEPKLRSGLILHQLVD